LELRLDDRVQLAELEGPVFEENRRNSFLRLPIRGSNPVASSDGGEWLYRAKAAGQMRETEFVPMLLMHEEFAQ
jgi:hypothetical protein